MVGRDPESGTVRGILCFPCNSLLGRAKDDPQTLMTAAQDLLRYGKTEAVDALGEAETDPVTGSP
ncbi:MAG: hypothetical protein JRN59_07195 [Nitrososphaerota archaeon]|nr:hypothetical protein [Nitrososphaerota archaeon]